MPQQDTLPSILLAKCKRLTAQRSGEDAGQQEGSYTVCKPRASQQHPGPVLVP